MHTLMSNEQKAIIDSTTAFQSIVETDLLRAFRDVRLIGFGENPHGVKEYFPIVRDVVKGLLSHGCKVLVLLEYEYWLNRSLDDHLHGRNGEFERHTFHDPDAGVFYGAGLRQFYHDLRTLTRSCPDRLSCRHVDFFMNPLNDERSEHARAVDQGKWDISRGIRQLLKENKPDQFAEAREQFLFQESLDAYVAFQPDVTVMLAGSFHVSKQGGCPFGDVFVKPVMARLAESINETPVSVRFAVLEGAYAKLECRSGMISKVPANCREWGQQDIQIEFKTSIDSLIGDSFVTALAAVSVPKQLLAAHAEWAANWDYLVTLRHGTADMPLDD
ncbi:MAG: hypothetical protein MUF78_07275 [Candidatus Edwardsbacteria bacterium]|jgi:hypothetical protein|nr:hypothetical protein [Candidatus Edwardsbacteria bacterium]